MKCKFAKECKGYREESYTCNYAVDKDYCGTFREKEKKNDI